MFKDKIHLIMFTPEGYEQVEDNSDGGSDKGGGDDRKSEENLEEETFDAENGEDKVPKDKEKTKEKDSAASKGQEPKSAPTGSKNVRRLLQFEDDIQDQQDESLVCAKLLGAMELDDEEDSKNDLEGDLSLTEKEDEETCNLLEEWVFEFSKEGEDNMEMSL